MNMSLPSRIALSFFLFLGAYFLYCTWKIDENYAIYIIPCVIGVVVTFILSPQIDWWMYVRNTPELSEEFRKRLYTNSTIYEALPADKKALYRKRIYLFMIGNDFSGMGGFEEEIPEDIKFCVSAQATLLTLNLDKFLFPKYEKVIVYQHRFPSPQYPEHFHASEIYEEDGCLLFDAELILRSTIEPVRLFNPVLYEYYKVYKQTYPLKHYPIVYEADIEKGIEISGFKLSDIEATIGLPYLEHDAILATYYFVFGERFKKINPTLFNAFDHLFGIY